ncbi:hypothetical protein PoB_003526900 [Plakobranchus ocellatus]|uniref:DUF4520 domain-containing protein n=1 Tax=Plakobranchus ocellatus TaxID=259542 RepID=A0AAV4ALY4_9GAST|nr:hypothetical protein PoB_003526900 [Plakobranchus ocellatus]
MSGTVPLLMVLYNNDTVEIRYSDSSTLQLSSCGSTMIHSATPSQGKCSKMTKSSSTHKRSRFVTSEHRQKVLQAMDFRNRFAQRPYLCEELLEKDQIVALYANIENVSWPTSPAEATVDILQDGSRKINSLDEYASLVISPHGHDFTVCYLSKISHESVKPKPDLAGSTKSESFQSRSGFSQPRAKPGMAKSDRSLKAGDVVKSNSREAVVHPFQCAERSNNDYNCQSELNDVALNHRPPSLIHHGFAPYNSEDRKEKGNDSSQRPHLQKCETDNQLLRQFSTCQVNTTDKKSCHQHTSLVSDELSLSEKYDSCRKTKMEDPPELPLDYQIHKLSGPFPNSSINSHDISSISRSSTPDGLRTMVDSDATLGTQDTSATAGHPLPVYKQRHSSPTHFTSSPYEEAFKVKSRSAAESQLENEGALGASYIAEDCVAVNVENLSLDKSGLDKTICEESHVLLEQSRTVIGQESDSDIDTQKLSPTHQRTGVTQCRDFCHPVTQNAAENLDTNTTQQDKFGSSPQQQISTYTHPEGVDSEKQCSELSGISLHRSHNEAEGTETKQQKSCARNLYVWTTSHGSRNDCPPAWTQPLKLALAQKTRQDTQQQEQAKNTAAPPIKGKSKGKQLSPVPIPLPLTCPFQHLHRWDADKTLDVTDLSGSLEFQHGMLKVVISEGIVYRFVKVANIHIVEVHPGDGSIIVSQGVKGHFFTHYIIAGDQLEERTYSLKSLPPGLQKGRYSISKLIQTANRYLLMNRQWEKRGLKQDLPCWKREVVAVVEPLSSSLLEECVVEGVGKFSAFTNGRVRAVFDDRTALDMMCNFSRRVSECLHHSQELQTSLPAASQVTLPMSSYEAIFGASSARLLLPSGQYVTVDIQNPGKYRNYIQAGREWASWVNSSPMERHQFYTQQHTPTVMQRAAEHELKKIFCFNYILEQSLLIQQEDKIRYDKALHSSPQQSSSAAISVSQDQSSLPAFHGSTQPMSPGKFIIKTQPGSDSPNSLSRHSNRLQFDPSLASTGMNRAQQSDIYARYSQSECDYVSPRVTHELARSDLKAQNIVEGFDAVRQVLLRNSNLINDIDEFLDSSRKQHQES